MKIPKQVTERDFRRPEFMDADPNDYEFREDGAIVRKDRWEQGIRKLAGNVMGPRVKFEVDPVVELAGRAAEACKEIYEEFCLEEVSDVNKAVWDAWEIGRIIVEGY